MTDLAKLVVKLEAQTAQYQRELDRANKKLGKFEKGTRKSISGIKTALGGLAIGATIAKIGKATAKQEQALAQLEQGLKSTGNAAGFTTEELTGLAAGLQKVTTFADEDVINAMANLATFTNIAGDEFKRTTEAALDLSTRTGQDLKSSVIQLGKALNDPVANLGALGRTGIQFSEDQKDLIKSLAETGNLAEAQRVILAELETQYGGSARAARDTFGGAIEGLQNAFGDLLEAQGGLEDNRAAVEQFTALLQDPRTVASANALTSALISGFSGVVNLVNNARSAINTFLGRAESLGEVQFEIERIEKILAKSNTLVGKLQRTVLFSSDGLISVKGTEELEAKLDALKAKRDELLSGSPAPTTLGARNPTFTPPTFSSTSSPANDEATKRADQLAEQRRRELQDVLDFLKTEEQLLAESYERQRQIVVGATEITQQEKMQVLDDLQDQYLKEVEVKAERINKSVDEIMQTDSSTPAFDRFFGPDALANLIIDFENVEENFKRMLLNMAQAMITSGITNAFAGFATGGAGGAGAGIFGALFGGARAEGGPVSPGRAYLVGERGPEMFMPRTAGNIIPNGQSMESPAVNIRNINAFDTDVIGDYMASPQGEKVVLNIARRNQRTFRTLAT